MAVKPKATNLGFAREEDQSKTMESSEKKKKKTNYRDETSELPDPILHSILSLLPIKQAARTSILSKSWRYLWTSIPHLSFNDLHEFVKAVYEEDFKMFISMLYQILDSRFVPVHSCRITVSFLRKYKEDFDEFIYLLENLGVKVIVLNNKEDRALYPLSFCAFAFKELEKLVLRNFALAVPGCSEYVGVCCLKTLEIDGVDIADEEFERLVSLCVCLESLVLKNCRRVKNLKIVGPNLLSLDVCTDRLICISLENVTRLVNFSISFQLCGSEISSLYFRDWFVKRNKVRVESEAHKLIKLLISLNHVESLSLHCCNEFVKRLFRDTIPENLIPQHHLLNLKKLTIGVDLSDVYAPSFISFLLRSCRNLQEVVSQCSPRVLKLPAQPHLLNLKKLTVEIKFSGVNAPSFISCLLRICPNLQELVVQGSISQTSSMVESDYWERQVPPKCLMYHLMKVCFYRVDINCELIRFVKFLLLNAHVLKKMSILHWKSTEKHLGGVVKELSLLQRASPDVVFEFKTFG